MQQSLRHLDTAFKSFFTNEKIGFPKFKSRKNKKSYTTICVNNNISVENGFLKLPKIEFVKIKQYRQIPEDYKIKSVTLSQIPRGKYYASILCEYESQVQTTELKDF